MAISQKLGHEACHVCHNPLLIVVVGVINSVITGVMALGWIGINPVIPTGMTSG